MHSLPEGYRALVLGASGAIGGSMADQLRADPRCATVCTLGRDTQPGIDFAAPESIAEAAQALQAQAPWHLIVVATGMLQGTTGGRRSTRHMICWPCWTACSPRAAAASGPTMASACRGEARPYNHIKKALHANSAYRRHGPDRPCTVPALAAQRP